MRNIKEVHLEKVKLMQQLIKEIRALEVVIPLLEEPSDSMAISKEQPNVEI